MGGSAVSYYDTDLTSICIAGHFPEVPFPSLAQASPDPVLVILESRRGRIHDDDKNEPLVDFTGETIGLIEILSIADARRRGRRYNCRCKGCGIEFLKGQFCFDNGLAKTCGLDRCRQILKAQQRKDAENGHA
jgi:hypothetical protein